MNPPKNVFDANLTRRQFLQSAVLGVAATQFAPALALDSPVNEVDVVIGTLNRHFT